MEVKDPRGMARMLREAMYEIQNLRRRNEVLQAVSNTVDAFSMALRSPGQNGGSYTQDVCGRLGQAADHLDTLAKPTTTQDTGVIES